MVREAGAAALEKAYLTPRKTAPADAAIEDAIGTPLRVKPVGRASTMLTAQEVATMASTVAAARASHQVGATSNVDGRVTFGFRLPSPAKIGS